MARVDFQSGDENVWLWFDPDFDAEPDTLFADANGTAKEFGADFVRAQLSDTTAGMDELRLGLGLGGLSLHPRRQRSASARRPRAPTA